MDEAPRTPTADPIRARMDELLQVGPGVGRDLYDDALRAVLDKCATSGSYFARDIETLIAATLGAADE